MMEKYYTKETGWTDAGIKEQERRADLTKLTARELIKFPANGDGVWDEIVRRLELLEQAERLNVFFRDSVGECHVMISRKTAEYQIRREWDACDLPPRLQKIMRERKQALERLEKCEKDAAEWKVGADILGERLITTEKRLEKCEATIRAAKNLLPTNQHCQCRVCEAGRILIEADAARAALENV